MTTRSMSVLDELLEAWRYTRLGVIAEIKNLPDDVDKLWAAERSGDRAAPAATGPPREAPAGS